MSGSILPAVIASVLRPWLEPLNNSVSFAVSGRKLRVGGVDGSLLAFGDVALGTSFSERINNLDLQRIQWRWNENRARARGAK